LSFVELT